MPTSVESVRASSGRDSGHAEGRIIGGAGDNLLWGAEAPQEETKMGRQDDLDSTGATETESKPTSLKHFEECIGIHRGHRIRDGHVDIDLDINDTTISVRIDDPESELTPFVVGLRNGERIGVFRLNTPDKYFIRRVPS